MDHLPEELAALFVELDGVEFGGAHLVRARECDDVLQVCHFGHRDARHCQGPEVLTGCGEKEIQVLNQRNSSEKDSNLLKETFGFLGVGGGRGEIRIRFPRAL